MVCVYIMYVYYIVKQISFLVLYVLAFNITTFHLLSGSCSQLIFFRLRYYFCPGQASHSLQSKY